MLQKKKDQVTFLNTCLNETISCRTNSNYVIPPSSKRFPCTYPNNVLVTSSYVKILLLLKL